MSEEREIDLKKSLKEHGQIYPIIESQYGIVDGFHRKMSGARDVRRIIVKDRADHARKRLLANMKAKSTSEHFNDIQKCLTTIIREFKLKKPGLKGKALQEAVCEYTSIAPRTYYKYLPEEFKDQTKAEAGKLGGKATAKRDDSAAYHAAKPKLHNERYKVYQYVLRNFSRYAGVIPNFKEIIKEITRDEKPYLKTKDDIDRYWKATRTAKTDPFTVFVEQFYLYDGPFMGWRFGLPWWIRLRLKEYIEREGENLDPESLAIKILGDWTVEHGITNEQTIERAKSELRKEWVLGKKNEH